LHAPSEEKSEGALEQSLPEISYEHITRRLLGKSGEREYFEANNWTGRRVSIRIVMKMGID